MKVFKGVSQGFQLKLHLMDPASASHNSPADSGFYSSKARIQLEKNPFNNPANKNVCQKVRNI